MLLQARTQLEMGRNCVPFAFAINFVMRAPWLCVLSSFIADHHSLLPWEFRMIVHLSLRTAGEASEDSLYVPTGQIISRISVVERDKFVIRDVSVELLSCNNVF